MLTADDLTRIAEVVRQELARALHPSVQRPAPAPLPAALGVNLNSGSFSGLVMVEGATPARFASANGFRPDASRARFRKARASSVVSAIARLCTCARSMGCAFAH